jgi:hypothetical protein
MTDEPLTEERFWLGDPERCKAQIESLTNQANLRDQVHHLNGCLATIDQHLSSSRAFTVLSDSTTTTIFVDTSLVLNDDQRGEWLALRTRVVDMITLRELALQQSYPDVDGGSGWVAEGWTGRTHA